MGEVFIFGRLDYKALNPGNSFLELPGLSFNIYPLIIKTIMT